MEIQIDVEVGYPLSNGMERVLGLVEASGEPITVTFRYERKKRTALVPAATLARWEHWAPTAYPKSETGDENRTETENPELAHPAEFGEYTLFRRRVGGRTAVARNGVVIAEFMDPDETQWLQRQARQVREGFMDPKQKAAFEEFLDRQPPVGKQRHTDSRSGRAF